MGWLRGFGLGLALLSVAACATTPVSNNEDVACAASLLFVGGEPWRAGSDAGFTLAQLADLDLRRLSLLEAQGCNVEQVLMQFDDGQDATRLAIAEQLSALERYALAVDWYEKADSLAGYTRLLELHGVQGPLADDAEYLRYEVKRAQLQQAFGQAVDWPSVGRAQPLFVQSSRTALHAEPDLDAGVIEGLTTDERVYLLDVVMLAEREDYWVHAYYPPTLALGWIPAQDMAQYPQSVRRALDDIDAAPGRNYAQQLMFTALLHGMDRSQLVTLSEQEFFAGAEQQGANSVALIQRLGTVADACLDEVAWLEQAYARYLMGEGPNPLASSNGGFLVDNTAYASAVREALAALTGRPSPGFNVDESLAADLSEQAYQYFRIRSFGQIEQRLCHSLPNAAGNSEFADPTCDAVASLQSCINRIDAILTTL